jgi:hypothetical protein
MSDILKHEEIENQTLEKSRVVEELLRNLASRIQNKECDGILEDLKNAASPLQIQLSRIGVDVKNYPSQNPKTERVGKRQALLPSGQEAPEKVFVFGWLVDGSGVSPVSRTELLLSVYTPEPETITKIQENFGADFVEESKRSFCLLFAEELAHANQHFRGMKEGGQFFISNEMMNLEPPQVGLARRYSIELDARLYLANIGFGSIIKDSLWLKHHEAVYGETLRLAEWARVELTPDAQKYF